MLEPGFQPAQLAVLENDQTPPLLDERTQDAPTDRVTITDYRSRRVTVRAEVDQPGYLVLTDTWYPGWIASVDDSPAPIYIADHIFRAVLLPPGSHTITFEFRPMSLMWGSAISGISLLLCIASAIVDSRRNARPTRPLDV